MLLLLSCVKIHLNIISAISNLSWESISQNTVHIIHETHQKDQKLLGLRRLCENPLVR